MRFHVYLTVPIYLLHIFFFFNDTATTEIYTLSLHDALPICERLLQQRPCEQQRRAAVCGLASGGGRRGRDRKSTRLNSSHLVISYAVFCLKKKKRKGGCIVPRRDVLLNVADAQPVPR